MSRRASEFEVRSALAGFARIPSDDVDGYVIVLAKGSDVICTVSNGADLSTQLMLLARAIEHRAIDVRDLESAAQRADSRGD
jgi:hypothetical protein